MDLSIAKPFLEKLRLDRATIIEFQDVKDPITHITTKKEIVVHDNVPCKLSHRVPQASGEGESSSLSLSSYISLDPDVTIKPGSKIIVTRNGKEIVFGNSGEPAIGINHQRVMLKLWKEYA